MTTVGKKKKRKVVYRASKRSPVIPLLIVGGVVVWYLISKSKAASETAADTTTVIPPVDQTGLQDSTLDPTIAVAPPVVTTPAPVAYVDIFEAIPDLAAMTKDTLVSFLTPLIKTIYGYNSVNISGYTLPRLQLMYAIGNYIPYSNIQYWKAFNSMSERELGDVWDYVSAYLAKKKALIFVENPVLYNEIAAIKTKFGIF